MIEVLAVIVLLAVVAAIFALETPNLMASVISVGAVGFLLAIAFLFLAAPDIAIVQIGVEVVTLVILIRATLGRQAKPVNSRRGLVGMIAAAAIVVAIGLFGVQLFAHFPEFGYAAMDRFMDAPATAYLETGLAETGAPNAVTAVLLDFRAYDTLGEATVLFCAVIGAVAILRRRARRQGPHREEDRV